jgi:hypothetical protein
MWPDDADGGVINAAGRLDMATQRPATGGGPVRKEGCSCTLRGVRLGTMSPRSERRPSRFAR